jgi:DNA-binding response OmpR family regulator
VNAAAGPDAPTVADVAEILIVEDDDLIATGLARALRSAGHEPVVAGTVAAARELAGGADLVLCDLGLPDGDGLDLIADIAAARPGVPVIALTARAEEGDVVAGLASGAVDYVTKPFRLAELQARIAAHLRQASAGPSARSGVVEVGDLGIDLDARRVTVGGEEVALRPREFDLLARLAADAGKVVRREDIMRDVWDEHWWGSTKTLDVHLNALRRKLGEEPGSPSRITAIRGVGYRLEAD